MRFAFLFEFQKFANKTLRLICLSEFLNCLKSHLELVWMLDSQHPATKVLTGTGPELVPSISQIHDVSYINTLGRWVVFTEAVSSWTTNTDLSAWEKVGLRNCGVLILCTQISNTLNGEMSLYQIKKKKGDPIMFQTNTTHPWFLANFFISKRAQWNSLDLQFKIYNNKHLQRTWCLQRSP